MDTRFEIFRIGTCNKGEPVGEAPNVDIAVWLVEALGICAPGRYLILSKMTGNSLSLEADADGNVTPLPTAARPCDANRFDPSQPHDSI